MPDTRRGFSGSMEMPTHPDRFKDLGMEQCIPGFAACELEKGQALWWPDAAQLPRWHQDTLTAAQGSHCV